MSQPSPYDTTDVVPVQNVTIANSRPDPDDLGRGLVATRCPSESGAGYRLPLANAEVRAEHWVAGP